MGYNSKRNNDKGGYRQLDNRDQLPFSVRTKTPDDPYRSRYLKEREKQELRKINKEINRNFFKNNELNDTTPSRLVQRRFGKLKKNGRRDVSGSDDDTTTVIGEFHLDKSTTSGDIIAIGDKEYQVQTARCQYRYAGGQRFDMVRKILEVKELTRARKEEAFARQYR